MGPDGERVIVEVCCHNLDYDAENILIEAGIPELDKLVAITPDKRTQRSLEQTLDKKRASFSSAPVPAVRVLDAAECLAKQFDWAAELTQTEWTGRTPDVEQNSHSNNT